MRTLYIGENVVNSATKVLFDSRDFIDLVEQYMGRDAARYLEDLIEEDKLDQDRMAQDLQDAYNEGAEDAWSHQDFEQYNNGHEDGYDEGYKVGYAEGYAEGFKAGHERRNPWA